ncbi:MAG: DCC1-like thiol-disulfide oxidoreductase family protein [Sphingobacterium sp.]|jgi:predicted DCC family thiol-disulfide oxidoreductase YuxK|uniref:thiol-disulfide oxidoreductase DCC family protein n=1 Tax=Sphingobacterium sp. TaxID=341027 RepID=UPI0028207684|nr:DCC1-like thiol-disulfide oxidoreductase family protein [Sphingobacterium sp.]MDR0263347.1 DCC1-like thiol-disulfide oxidoreductase family protein [Sphingobacterium sp.]
MEQQGKHIIFFDGDCLICNRFVQILLRIDRKKKFLFSSLQSELARTALINIPKNIDSIVYLSPAGSYIKSEAVLKICKQLGFPYTACYLFKILPLKWRDALYDYFAKNRYRWFGKNEFCAVPTKSERQRFI